MPIRTEQDPYLEQPQLQKMQWMGCNVTYQGAPNVTVKIDGTTRFGPQALPAISGNGLTNRTIWLPYLCFGYKPDLSWDAGDIVEKYDWISVPPSAFKERKLWDSITFTFEGTITVTVELDGTSKTLLPYMVLTTTAPQDTRTIYFPFGSFGYKVNIGTTYDSATSKVLDWEPTALIDRVYDTLRLATQFQISHVGDVTIQIGKDGANHGGTLAFTGSGTTQITKQSWIAPGCRANYFQYQQTAGTGKVINLKTNEARTDQEEPPTIKPEQLSR